MSRKTPGEVQRQQPQSSPGQTSPERLGLRAQGDGRYVAFHSDASNLAPGSDTNGYADVFVYDRQTDVMERVTLAAEGMQGNDYPYFVSISADGRYVAFRSVASTLVPGDTNGVGDDFVTTNPFAWASGSHVVVLAEGQNVAGIDFDNASPTKFYVVNDATQNLTYEYNANGQLNESYNLNSGNTAPRGAASTIAGDKTWVVDANRKVYVYNNSGTLLGSWTAGSLNTKAVVEGIATNGTDVWIVDANSDKVYKYTTAGALVSSWTITTAGATSPTGITIDPANLSNFWIVDSGTDRVYQYNAAATFANGSSHAADVAFALAVGNTNPQGIADPPARDSLLVTDTPILSEPVSAEAALRGTDAALASMYDEPLKKFRVDTVPRSESLGVEHNTRDLSYTVGASALAEPVAHRIVDDSRWANDNHRQAEVDDLFAQWESGPLQLFSFPNLGM